MNELDQIMPVKRAESTSTQSQAYGGNADPNLIFAQQNTEPLLEQLYKNWTFSNCMNDFGIKTVINEIRTRSCNISFLSNMTEEEIYRLKEECEHTINELLFTMEDEFDLIPAYKDLIINQVGQAVLIGLNRAKGQGERLFLGKTFEQKQIFQEREAKKKGLKAIF